MSTPKPTNKNVLFYTRWNEETAKRWLKKIFDFYDKNGDGYLEREEINDWRQRTTHPALFEPFESDEDWIDYLKTHFGVDLGGEAKITFDQLFHIQKIVDTNAMYLGGNTLFTDIWHMLDQGVISDAELVPHVVQRSRCSICGELKRMVDFKGVNADTRGEGGQWLKPDNERVCVDCEEIAAYRTVTRYFELGGVNFKFRFSYVRNPEEQSSHEVTKLYVDDEVVGRIDSRAQGPSFLVKNAFKDRTIKTVSYFSLADSEPQKTVDEAAASEAKEYFEALAKRAGTDAYSLALILSDLFLFPSPHEDTLFQGRGFAIRMGR